MWRLFFYFSILSFISAAPSSHLVSDLPYLPDTPNFKMYSGYLKIPISYGKELFYFMVESQNKPQTDPVVLWLNGGPGCSSLDGFFYQHGPYIFDHSTSLKRNPYSWNKNATMIYLDSPAGVGFSKVDQGKNSTNDQITAYDSLKALVEFFKLFPELKKNDFYISGESYAGIYVPRLAYNILLHNKYSIDQEINLKGFAVGNGCTDFSVDNLGATIQMAYSHSLIWWEDKQELDQKCGVENILDFQVNQECQEVADRLMDQLLNTINIYDIYGDCFQQEEQIEKKVDKFRFFSERHPKFGVIPPCVEWEGIYGYLRDSKVRQALHVPQEVQEWELCTDIEYTVDFENGSFYTYPFLMKSGLRIWIYTGDTDLVVPFVGTREWIKKLGLPVIQKFRPWYLNQQVAGFYEVYDKLTYVTVKGAGHMVPQVKPEESLYMFNQFLKGDKLQMTFSH